MSNDLLSTPTSLALNGSKTINSKIKADLDRQISNSLIDENLKRINSIKNASHSIDDDDDVETALSKLEKSLDIVETVENKTNQNTAELVNRLSEGIPPSESSNKNSQTSDLINEIREYTNELCEELFLMKQQKYTLKKYKSYYFILNDTHYLSYFKSREESKGKPIDKINMRGCELVPDVNISGRKFGINLKVPSTDGMNEISLRCPNEESYAKWMSACKLASKNKSISDPAFTVEVNSILNLLSMQQKRPVSIQELGGGNRNGNSVSISSCDNSEVQATNLLPSRMLKKYKLKQLNDKVLEAYSTISDLDLFEAKWRYIKSWQALPTYGISYFVVKVKGSRYKEVIDLIVFLFG